MTAVLVGIVCWVVLSVPVSLVVGRLLARRSAELEELR